MRPNGSRAQGFDAHSLDGGLPAWKWAGRPLTGRITEPIAAPEGLSSERALHDEVLAVLSALPGRFGERELSKDERHAFRRQRLLQEGRTPEEADTFLAQMGGN